MEKHLFWKNQPIDSIKLNDSSKIINQSIEIKTVDDIKKETYPLPEGYEWHTFDLNNETDLNLLYSFLLEYYVNNPLASKRFHYSKELLKWFLISEYNDLILGVKYKNKIYATICGIPMTVRILDKTIRMVEINFLCVHYKLRNKRLSPVLIKEVTRRTNLHNIWQAFYTTSLELPNNLFDGTYYHRYINVPKLMDLNISFITETNAKLASKLYKIMDNLTINIRLLEEKDCKECCEKFNKFHEKFKISAFFNEEEFKSHFLQTPSAKVIYSYVVENENGITDFISFFDLSTQVRDHPKYNTLKVAYGYYYFYFNTSLETLVSNSLLLLKKEGFELLNYLDQYDNQLFFDKLKFKKGSASMNFNFFNWICPTVKNNEVALIMI
jgi:glycylpeptide N-tetradecanoyltransferase